VRCGRGGHGDGGAHGGRGSEISAPQLTEGGIFAGETSIVMLREGESSRDGQAERTVVVAGRGEQSETVLMKAAGCSRWGRVK
jgi:hypothetical protein